MLNAERESDQRLSTSSTASNLGDKVAMALSLLCFIHCLALPLLVLLAPSVWLISLSDESFHQLLFLAVIPISSLALWRGFKQHRRLPVLALVMLGLLVLGMAVGLGHDRLGEWGEKLLTLVGALLVAAGHWWNYRVRLH
jgi:hypothetical protein